MVGFRTITKIYILRLDKIADLDAVGCLRPGPQARIGANHATCPQPCPLDM